MNKPGRIPGKREVPEPPLHALQKEDRMGRNYRVLPALLALTSIVAGCTEQRSASSLPAISTNSAPAPQTAAVARPDVTLTVRPKSLFLSEPGAQGEIHVTYNGSGRLTAVSSRPHGMPVHAL